MKSTFISLLVLVSLTVTGQSLPEVPQTRLLFKLSPQHFTQNTLKAGGELFNKNFTHSFALFTSVSAGNHDDYYSSYMDYRYEGLTGEFQYRKYISPVKLNTTRKGKEYYQGIYFAGFAQAGGYSGNRYYGYNTFDSNGNIISIVEYDYHESIRNFAFGFTLGVQRTLWKVLFIDVYVGGGLQLSTIDRTGQLPQHPGYYYYSGGITEPAYEGILPKFGLQIGIGL